MGLAEELEKRLERVVEGFFSKAFRSAVQPAEIGRRILREQEGGKSVSVGAVYVPNRYLVTLSTADYPRFEGLAPQLSKEFVTLLEDSARERKWVFPGAVSVAFETDEKTVEGRFHVTAFHEAGQAGDGVGAPLALEAKLRLVDGDLAEEWLLENEAVLGRQEGSTIHLSDQNVSRNHALLQRREDAWWILDTESTNGTYVNDVIVKERKLRSGDVIQVGSTRLEFLESER